MPKGEERSKLGPLVLPDMVLLSREIEQRFHLRQKLEPLTRENEYRCFARYSQSFLTLDAIAHSAP